jgi:hypothetical protein
VGILAEGNAVSGIVVAAVGKLVNVAGINDSTGVERNQPLTPRFGHYADSKGLFDPLLWGKRETVEAGLHFNPVEFHGIKTRIVELFPNTEEFDGIAILYPVPDQIIGFI